jgi:dihydroflavonol-4-reductase
MKILITGASGFIGGFLVEGGLQRGHEVWAAVRKGSRTDYLTDSRIHLIELDFDNKDSLSRSMERLKAKNGSFDVVIHAAGATKCIKREQFFKSNTLVTRNLVESLRDNDMLPVQFIYLSTLGVFGPAKEQFPHAPIEETDEKCPNTYYGKSKLETERFLESIPELGWLIMRPTGVYGPREKDYFLITKGVKLRMDLSAGFSAQSITFVYVRDLVKAIYLAVDKGVIHKAYFVTDGNSYQSRSFSDRIAQEMGNRRLLHIKVPLFVVKIISVVSGGLASLLGYSFTLNKDKYHILCQRNWLCNITPLRQDLGFEADYSLQSGVRETVRWYIDHHWL